MATLQNILDDVAAVIDQDTTIATGTELTVRVNYINQSQKDWAQAYQWKNLRVANHTPAFALSLTSVALPSNFKKLMSVPTDVALTSANQYPEIRPEDRINRPLSDKYSFITGNDSTGWALNINPALVSGASLRLDYQSNPSSLATLSSIAVCPSDRFLASRTLYYILLSRSDNRFPIQKSESDDLLAQMISEEDAKSLGENNTTPNFLTRTGFRVGVD